jgi:hypothetical protein
LFTNVNITLFTFVTLKDKIVSEYPFVLSYPKFAATSLAGRYLPYDAIKKLTSIYSAKKIGESVLGTPIELIEMGKGETKVFMWSQMHGNESTTTKAVFDMLSYLTHLGRNSAILTHCTLYVIPMLNPDGSGAYTRLNANQVDLNRDAIALSQPESRVLRETFDQIQPDFCFNLHDQRTIFGAGSTGKPATVSFLAPAANPQTTITPSRKVAMALIAVMNEVLQLEIPNQVGRFDDSYNANCVGDTFQTLGVPTILFESGHYPGDYHREQTRRLICTSLLVALTRIASSSYNVSDELYAKIPENQQIFVDLIVTNVPIIFDGSKTRAAVAIQYQETLENNEVVWIPKYRAIGDLSSFFAHTTLDFDSLADVHDHEFVYNLNTIAPDCFNFNILKQN